MMRVSMIGPYTLDAFTAAIRRLMREFAANEVHSITKINLYVTPTAKGREIPVLRLDGSVVDHLHFDTDRATHSPQSGTYPADLAKRSEVATLRGSTVDWKGGDAGYLKAKWRLSVEELAALLDVTPGRALTILACPAAALSPEERVRLAILLEINTQLLDRLHGRSAADWLRSASIMSAFDGGSPLEQMVHFGISALDRMHRALARQRCLDLGRFELDGLAAGFDWILDLPYESSDPSNIWPEPGIIDDQR